MLIREKDKLELVRIFATLNIPFEVWAYGSRVAGGAHDGSDLDLVIRGPGLEALPLDTFDEVCEKIRDSNIPILVELRDWARLPPAFHVNIEHGYEVLFDNRSL